MVYPFFNEGFGNVTFCCNEMGILCVNLDNIILDSNFLIRPLAGHSKFKKRKACKKR